MAGSRSTTWDRPRSGARRTNRAGAGPSTSGPRPVSGCVKSSTWGSWSMGAPRLPWRTAASGSWDRAISSTCRPAMTAGSSVTSRTSRCTSWDPRTTRKIRKAAPVFRACRESSTSPLLACALFALTATANAYDATIKYTKYGVPHITGKDFGDLGYGYGFAFAKDNVCTMADQYVTVRAQRSKFFGPDGTYIQRGNGTTVKNLDSDFFWKRIIDDHVVEKLMARKPPLGPRDDIREGVRGYVAGWNKYLDDIGGPDGISDPACKGKSWVTKITDVDAYRRFY